MWKHRRRNGEVFFQLQVREGLKSPPNTTLKPAALVAHRRTSSGGFVRLRHLLGSTEGGSWQGHRVAEPAGTEGEATSLVDRSLGSQFLCLRGRVTTLDKPTSRKEQQPWSGPSSSHQREDRGPGAGGALAWALGVDREGEDRGWPELGAGASLQVLPLWVADAHGESTLLIRLLLGKRECGVSSPLF